MDSRNRNHLCAVLFIEVFKVRQVLEVVSVNFAAVNNVIRLNVIGKFLNVKRYILFLKNFLSNRKYFCMGCGRSRNRDFRTGKFIVIYR